MKVTLRKLPFVHSLYRFAKGCYYTYSGHPFTHAMPPGHYYSPLPRLSDILRQETTLFCPEPKERPGIELNEAGQLKLLDQLARFYDDLPFSEQSDQQRRYYYENGFFFHFDAIVLYAMLRSFRPRQVIEIGSGFSSALMLDTNEAFLDGATKFTFIEPYPEERLAKLLSTRDKSRHQVIARPVQEVELECFDQLQSGDFLFVDSSHVVKVASDVARIVFEILPRLPAGVIVHFHDVFWPFEYPREWFLAGRAWNEAYFLRAFLQYNHAFEILFFPSFLEQFHRDQLTQKMPLCLRNAGSSLWLRKVH